MHTHCVWCNRLRGKKEEGPPASQPTDREAVYDCQACVCLCAGKGWQEMKTHSLFYEWKNHELRPLPFGQKWSVCVCRSGSQFRWETKTNIETAGRIRHLRGSSHWRSTAEEGGMGRAVCKIYHSKRNRKDMLKGNREHSICMCVTHGDIKMSQDMQFMDWKENRVRISVEDQSRQAGWGKERDKIEGKRCKSTSSLSFFSPYRHKQSANIC